MTVLEDTTLLQPAVKRFDALVFLVVAAQLPINESIDPCGMLLGAAIIVISIRSSKHASKNKGVVVLKEYQVDSRVLQV